MKEHDDVFKIDARIDSALKDFNEDSQAMAEAIGWKKQFTSNCCDIIQPEDLREVLAVPVKELRRFDPNWPSLKSMLAAWRSEMACENKAIVVPLAQKQKLSLGISVAQLAFFIKLFV